MNAIRSLSLAAALWAGVSAQAGHVSGTYTDVAHGTLIDLTATGNYDWVKWGNSTEFDLSYETVEKVGATIINPGLTILGTPPGGYTIKLGSFPVGDDPGSLEFSWTDGTAPMADGAASIDTVVTQYLDPAAFGYPIGMGISFTVNAEAVARQLDVYLQGFDADTLVTATMSGGGSFSTVVTPNVSPPFDPNNDFAIGKVSLRFLGAGETLTFSILTQNPRTGGAQSQFANTGLFAAAVTDANPVPEPSSAILALGGIAAFGFVGYRRARKDRSA